MTLITPLVITCLAIIRGEPAGFALDPQSDIEARTMRNRRTRTLQSAHKALGERIRGLRQEKGFSQAVFAEMCGIGPRYVARIEQGKSNLPFSVLTRIARNLEVTVFS